MAYDRKRVVPLRSQTLGYRVVWRQTRLVLSYHDKYGQTTYGFSPYDTRWRERAALQGEEYRAELPFCSLRCRSAGIGKTAQNRL